MFSSEEEDGRENYEMIERMMMSFRRGGGQNKINSIVTFYNELYDLFVFTM